MLTIKRPILMFVAITLLSIAAAPQLIASEVTKEDKVKAAIVYKLTKFINMACKKSRRWHCV